MRSHREPITKPCESCGKVITKTYLQYRNRRYWTCGASCSSKLGISLGNTPGWADNPLRGEKDTRPCVECGEPVTRYLNPKVADRPWTCSRSCRAKRAMRKRRADGTYQQPVKPRRGKELPCQVCGKMTYKRPGLIAKGVILCSFECNKAYQTKTPIIKECPGCGKRLTLKPSQGEQVYCSKRCRSTAFIKRPLDWMHNGRPARIENNGYVMVWEPDHPNKTFHGWQYLHRLVVEKSIGRHLRSDEAVHHKDGNKINNDLANLEVMASGTHAALSSREYREGVAERLARLEEYEHKFGPLS
jgi:endogenous inhibitor of DNA gyrase (YacG/DUF329 family)